MYEPRDGPLHIEYKAVHKRSSNWNGLLFLLPTLGKSFSLRVTTSESSFHRLWARALSAINGKFCYTYEYFWRLPGKLDFTNLTVFHFACFQTRNSLTQSVLLSLLLYNVSLLLVRITICIVFCISLYLTTTKLWHILKVRSRFPIWRFLCRLHRCSLLNELSFLTISLSVFHMRCLHSTHEAVDPRMTPSIFTLQPAANSPDCMYSMLQRSDKNYDIDSSSPESDNHGTPNFYHSKPPNRQSQKHKTRYSEAKLLPLLRCRGEELYLLIPLTPPAISKIGRKSANSREFGKKNR